MAGSVSTDTHPIDKFYIKSNPQTEHKFTEFNILPGKDIEQIVKK